MHRPTCRFARLTSGLTLDVFHGLLLTARGNAVLYRDRDGIHRLNTADATPVASIPEPEC